MGVSINKKNKFGSYFLFFGLAWLLFSIPFIATGYFMIQSESAYENSSKKTSGLLISKFERDSRSNKQTTRSYYFRYKFTDDRGQEIEGEDNVGSEIFGNAVEGRSVPVQYIPGSSREKNRVIDGSSDSIAGYLFIGFGVLELFVGAAFLVPALLRLAAINALEQKGTTTEGEITTVGPGTVSFGGVRQWQLKYKFKDSKGNSYEGRSEHFPPQNGQDLKKGDKVKVRYDKDRPTVNVWLG